MSFKAFALLAPVGLGGMWFAGAIGGGYERVVDRPPAQVMAALGDLDVREQPGAPGTDPSRSGGVAPLFRTERTADSISFVVMSGDKVATRMTAHLEPVEGGARTRVTASVERGDAPDDFVSPAFRSHGITLGLFSLALDGELNELTAPPRRSQAECHEIAERLLAAANPGGADRPRSLSEGAADGARMIIRLHGVEAELRRQGCDTSGGANGGQFRPVSNAMGAGGSGPPPGVSFAPGQPMVDVSRSRD
jgi:hypothetical protein